MSSELSARALDFSGARALFTGVAEGNRARHVGDDPREVKKRREALERKLGAPLVFVEQVHSADVAIVRTEADVREMRERARVADALVTPMADVALAIMVADCVPVVLAEESSGVMGAAHAGRRGLLGGVLGATVEAMASLGASPKNIHALIGPSVCGRCSEVPEQMFAESVAEHEALASRTSWGTPALDLPAGAVAELRAAGLAHESIEVIERCTLETEELFSYRRDPHTGRFAGVIWRHSPEAEEWCVAHPATRAEIPSRPGSLR